jgi:hypothetical protein
VHWWERKLLNSCDAHFLVDLITIGPAITEEDVLILYWLFHWSNWKKLFVHLYSITPLLMIYSVVYLFDSTKSIKRLFRFLTVRKRWYPIVVGKWIRFVSLRNLSEELLILSYLQGNTHRFFLIILTEVLGWTPHICLLKQISIFCWIFSRIYRTETIKFDLKMRWNIEEIFFVQSTIKLHPQT